MENLKDIPALLRCIHTIDHLLDNTGNLNERSAIACQTIISLTDPNKPLVIAGSEPEKIRRKFTQIDPHTLQPLLANLFDNTDRLRYLQNPREYAELTALDGINTAKILLLFLHLNPDKKIFRPFFTLAAVHKLIDSLHDLDEDFQNRQISVKPDQETKKALRLAIKSRLLKPFS